MYRQTSKNAVGFYCDCKVQSTSIYTHICTVKLQDDRSTHSSTYALRSCIKLRTVHRGVIIVTRFSRNNPLLTVGGLICIISLVQTHKYYYYDGMVRYVAVNQNGAETTAKKEPKSANGIVQLQYDNDPTTLPKSLSLSSFILVAPLRCRCRCRLCYQYEPLQLSSAELLFTALPLPPHKHAEPATSISRYVVVVTRSLTCRGRHPRDADLSVGQSRRRTLLSRRGLGGLHGARPLPCHW
jgi:hypothetical protein